MAAALCRGNGRAAEHGAIEQAAIEQGAILTLGDAGGAGSPRMDQGLLKLAVLGPPKVEIGGVPLRVDTRKAVALLAYLACSGRRHGRDQLAALLWPDADDAHARAERMVQRRQGAAQCGAGARVGG